jgi:predicted RNase H-like HicB family nuclease
MKYMVVVEKGKSGYGAYVPDLPGCVAASANKEELLQLIKEAVQFHIEGLVEFGQPIPEPSFVSEFVEVNAA